MIVPFYRLTLFSLLVSLLPLASTITFVHLFYVYIQKLYHEGKFPYKCLFRHHIVQHLYSINLSHQVVLCEIYVFVTDCPRRDGGHDWIRTSGPVRVGSLAGSWFKPLTHMSVYTVSFRWRNRKNHYNLLFDSLEEDIGTTILNSIIASRINNHLRITVADNNDSVRINAICYKIILNGLCTLFG